ncbi:uncharacterized protein METZ01_LOCUS453282, partial [marine metagenome]
VARLWQEGGNRCVHVFHTAILFLLQRGIQRRYTSLRAEDLV